MTTTYAQTPKKNIITSDIAFDVELRSLTADENLEVPNNKATVRVDRRMTDNGFVVDDEKVLSVVGSRYKVVDHKDVLQKFNAILEENNFKSDVTHSVFHDGASIYSQFVLEDEITVLEQDKNGSVTKKIAHPYFTFITTHDGSMKLGFIMGAKVNNRSYVLGTRVCEASVKHLRGIKIDLVLAQIKQSFERFLKDIIPLWSKMMITSLTLEQARSILDSAIKKNVLTEKKVKKISLSGNVNAWDLFDVIVDESSTVSSKSSGESSFWKNGSANDFFLQQFKNMVNTK